MGWMTTPDGRDGWSTLFLQKGHSAFLVDQPGRGEAGGAVGWDVPAENIAAIVAIEPDGMPQPGSEQYQRLLDAGIPIVVYFGDYIDNGPEDILPTGFWKGVRDGALAFAEQYNADGGIALAVDLPKEGITGNSHFIFQELDNAEIADHIEAWIQANVERQQKT